MSLYRKQIRDNAVSALTGLDITGARIYKNRVYPVAEANLPGLLVYTQDEEIITETMGSVRTQERQLSLMVEIYAQALSDYDNSVDSIADDVEEALLLDKTRGGLAQDTLMTNFEVEFSGEGDQPIAVGKMTFTVSYSIPEKIIISWGLFNWASFLFLNF